MRRRAIVLGAGGHCRVVLSILKAVDGHELLGIIDLGEPHIGEEIMGVAVIGTTASLETYRNHKDLDLFLCIGDNKLRKFWWQTAHSLGLLMPNLMSPHALIDPHALLGTANIICANAFIGPKALLGNNNLINTSAIVEHEARIGSHCHLAPAATLCGRSGLDDCCLVGAGATVIDFIQIAAEVTVGAGATVVSTITDTGGIYVGTPAKRNASQ